MRCGPHLSRPARALTLRARILGRLASLNACRSRSRFNRPWLTAATPSVGFGRKDRRPECASSSPRDRPQQPRCATPAWPRRAPPSQRPGLVRTIRATSSGPWSGVRTMGSPQALAQTARTLPGPLAVSIPVSLAFDSESPGCPVQSVLPVARAVRVGSESCSRRVQFRAIRVRSSWLTVPSARDRVYIPLAPQVRTPDSARALPKAAIARRSPRTARPKIMPTGSGAYEV